MIERVVVATDLSPACDAALTHGLRLVAGAGGALRLVHVASGASAHERLDAMPRVRALLDRWSAAGRLRPGRVDVVKAIVDAHDPVAGLLAELRREPPDLLVLGKHAYHGLAALLHRDVALAVARRARVPTLLLPDDSPGFVRADDGATALRRVVIATASDPPPGPAAALVERLVAALGAEDVLGRLEHVGDERPLLPPEGGRVRWSAGARPGRDVVDGVLEAARDHGADLLALASAWRQSVADHVLGSTTERIVRAARLPVLVAPA